MSLLQYAIQWAIVGGFLAFLLVPLWLPLAFLCYAALSLRRHVREGRWR